MRECRIGAGELVLLMYTNNVVLIDMDVWRSLVVESTIRTIYNESDHSYFSRHVINRCDDHTNEVTRSQVLM